MPIGDILQDSEHRLYKSLAEMIFLSIFSYKFRGKIPGHEEGIVICSADHLLVRQVQLLTS